MLGYDAVCRTGTFSITRLSSANPKEFYKKAKEQEDLIRVQAFNTVADKWEEEGKRITTTNDQKKFEEEQRAKISAFMHEWFEKNAKKYGYEYSWSPRTK